jgi:hypothetical protein
MRGKRILQKIFWAIFPMLFLTGCEMIKGFGDGLGNMFKSFKMP